MPIIIATVVPLKVGQKRRCEFGRIFCFKYISKTYEVPVQVRVINVVV